MTSDASARYGFEDRMHRAAAFKERVYVAFTTLAVVIVLRAHDTEPSALRTLGAVVVGVGATICAVYVADLLSHMVVHGLLPNASAHRRIVSGTLGAGVVAIPAILCLLIAWTGLWSTGVGLLLAMLATMAMLVAIGILAVHRLRLPWWLRAVLLVAEALLALIVVALELLSHA